MLGTVQRLALWLLVATAMACGGGSPEATTTAIECTTPADCDDGKYCSGVEQCQAGKCVAGPKPCVGGTSVCNRLCDEDNDNCLLWLGKNCSTDNNPCTDDVCGDTGLCEHVPNSASTCDDGRYCTGEEHCDAGECVSSGNPCLGGEQCNDHCNEATEDCITPADPVTLCEGDGDECSTEYCSGGECFPYDTVTGPCDDGLWCNGLNDECSFGTCQPTGLGPCAAECDAGCNEAVDECVYWDPLAHQEPCTLNTNNDCVNPICNEYGFCGVPYDSSQPCDPGVHNECIAEVCNELVTCGVPYDSSHPCTLTNPCLVNGACDGAGGCTGVPGNEGGSCNMGFCDGEGRQCHDGVCDPEVPPCPEDFTCTEDADGPGAEACLAPFQVLALGAHHTCGLVDPAGSLAYCWGQNITGQLGSASDGQAPRRVSGGLLFKHLVAGSMTNTVSHTCGLVVDGSAQCWGSDAAKQLGNGDVLTANQGEPSPVTMPDGVAFTALASGSAHVCALAATSGDVYCWGSDGSGQLGNGASTTADQSTPSKVVGGIAFKSITAGGSHTCGLSTANVAYCWGSDGSGELGDSVSLSNKDQPTAVLMTSVSGTFQDLSAGGSHTCGVTNTTAVYCWGAQEYGRLGNGNTAVASVPTPTAVGTTPGTLQSVAAGLLHTCGLTTAGVVVCWGQDEDGELGDGANDTTTGNPVAVSLANVSPDTTFVRLFSGGGAAQTCATTADNAVFCWGLNDYLQNGRGTGGINSVYLPDGEVKILKNQLPF